MAEGGTLNTNDSIEKHLGPFGTVVGTDEHSVENQLDPLRGSSWVRRKEFARSRTPQSLRDRGWVRRAADREPLRSLRDCRWVRRTEIKINHEITFTKLKRGDPIICATDRTDHRAEGGTLNRMSRSRNISAPLGTLLGPTSFRSRTRSIPSGDRSGSVETYCAIENHHVPPGRGWVRRDFDRETPIPLGSSLGPSKRN